MAEQGEAIGGTRPGTETRSADGSKTGSNTRRTERAPQRSMTRRVALPAVFVGLILAVLTTLYLLRDDIARLPDWTGARYWAWRLDSSDRATQLNAIGRLNECGADGASVLLDRLKSSKDQAIRRAAANALGSMEEQAPQVAEGLIELTDLEEARGALADLGRHALPALFDAVETTPARQDLHLALTEVVTRNPSLVVDLIEASRRRKIEGLIENVLRKFPPNLQAKVDVAIRKSSTQDHPALLWQLQYGSAPQDARVGLVCAGRQALPGLIQALGDPDTRFHNDVINIIAVIASDGEAALADIVAHLDDRDPRVTDGVVEVLARSLPEDVGTVLDQAEKGSGASRARAARAKEVLLRRGLLLR